MIASEQGMTVIETIIVALLGLILAGAAMSFLIVSLDQQNNVSSRALTTRQVESGLEQMVRDLREAMSQDASGNSLSATVATSASAKTTSFTFSIPTPGSASNAQSVTWTCPSAAEPVSYVGSCSRQVASGSSQTMIQGVQSVTLTPVDSVGVQHPLGTAVNASYTNPASVLISLSAQPISQLDPTVSTTLRGAAAGDQVVVNTSADLRNFG